MKIRVLMITHNRTAYTELSLARLCETVGREARITVWDNASSEETRSVLKRFESHPAVERIIYNGANDKLRGPTNWFWQNARDAEFLSKVDDDGLMPDRWTEILEQAHRDIPEAGIMGTWRFPDEDFVERRAQKKIQKFGAHQVLRNCWVEGSGYLMKRSVIDRIGLIREKESFTTYCIRAAAAGFVNGWYYPFLYQEHMDDPRAPHTGIKTEEDFRRLQPLTAQTFKVKSRAEWSAKTKELAWIAQVCSYDPRDYLGRRAWLKQKVCRILGKPYVPRA
ncbi:MAG: glycosyltransferase [Verrucomicrobiota bacterium]|jgi:glycosyltransferase involved in cell wall biosynthesis